MPNGESTNAENETDALIARNITVLKSNLSFFRESYWPIYESHGFTFPEGYIAWSTEYITKGTEDDDRDEREPWQR